MWQPVQTRSGSAPLQGIGTLGSTKIAWLIQVIMRMWQPVLRWVKLSCKAAPELQPKDSLVLLHCRHCSFMHHSSLRRCAC